MVVCGVGVNVLTLVLHEHSRALNIISKFESKKYIHSLTDSDGKNLRFFFPRYELTFLVHDGVLRCKEIAGYLLRPQQQIDKTLLGIEMYLLLKESCGKDEIIIFPKGKVVRTEQVHIELKDDCDAKFLWCQYRFHPRFHYIETRQLVLPAERNTDAPMHHGPQQSRASRMQLVALHVATSTVLPDELLGMTGEERAVTLLRQSWANCPLSDQECLALDNIMSLAHGLNPTVSLLCEDIFMSSKQFSFLYPNNGGHHECTVAESYEGSAYLNNLKNNSLSSRCYLTPREEEQVIGLQSSKPVLPRCLEPNQQLLPSPVSPNEIRSVQRRLDVIQKGLCTSGVPLEHTHSFPLIKKPSSKLDKSKNAFEEIQGDVVESRLKVGKFLLDALNQEAEQKSSHWHDNAQRMLRVAGRVPTAIAVDLATIAIDPIMIATFNPMIKDKSHLLESISIWLQLCVYEDKLARVLSFFKSGLIEDVMAELAIRTVWDTSKHPHWLVFEVENGIQIRQDQYKVAWRMLLLKQSNQIQRGFEACVFLFLLNSLYFNVSGIQKRYRDMMSQKNSS
ncbi:hypothetical protein ACHAW5_003524 [Stephanodiscus triporus]|uniref:DUF3638 domain-containing protein n=1 Tax=Stephanodiscus triporus TaxID=2934178 RepID=A0ABD3NK69_9STRA